MLCIVKEEMCHGSPEIHSSIVWTVRSSWARPSGDLGIGPTTLKVVGLGMGRWSTFFGRGGDGFVGL